MTQETFDDINLRKLPKDIPTLLIGDAIKLMNDMPYQSVDLIIDDCGYTDLDKHRSVGSTTRLTESNGSNMKWYEVVDYQWIVPFYTKLLKFGRHLYMYRPSLNQESIHNWCLLIQPNSGILNKNKFIIRKVIPLAKNYQGMGYSWNSRHEMILFAYRKGAVMKKLNQLELPDIYTDAWKTPRQKDKIHDSEKPLGVAKDIINNSSNKGEVVLEPFAGSFQSGLANTLFDMHRIVVGIEKNEIIAKRAIDYFKEKTKKDINIIRKDD